MRCGIHTFTGLNEIDSTADCVHGPVQLERPASWPSCFRRQSFAPPDEASMSCCICEASAASVVFDGSKMNARSFE